MALFNAPAWMMKGGGAAPVGVSSRDDNDPYKEGKKPVKLRIENTTLYITNSKTVYRLTFNVTQIGFTQNASNVSLCLELRVGGGHWWHSNSVATVNLNKSSQDIDISKQMSGEIKSLLLDTSYGNINSQGKGTIYLLFETNTEICDDQRRCSVLMK